MARSSTKSTTPTNQGWGFWAKLSFALITIVGTMVVFAIGQINSEVILNFAPGFVQAFFAPILAGASVSAAMLVAALLVLFARRFLGHGVAVGIGAAIGSAS